jgi:hypothetical protein
LSLQGTEMLDSPFIMPPSPNYSNFPKLDCCEIDKSAVISLKHYNMILSELRCPGCADNMSAPIRLCSKGHSVCDSCSQSRRCPLCQVSSQTHNCKKNHIYVTHIPIFIGNNEFDALLHTGSDCCESALFVCQLYTRMFNSTANGSYEMAQRTMSVPGIIVR